MAQGYTRFYGVLFVCRLTLLPHYQLCGACRVLRRGEKTNRVGVRPLSERVYLGWCCCRGRAHRYGLRRGCLVCRWFRLPSLRRRVVSSRERHHVLNCFVTFFVVLVGDFYLVDGGCGTVFDGAREVYDFHVLSF